MIPSHTNKPNFFILGAGRSGTTYLWHLLRLHPEIFLTRIKEPTFFCKQFQLVNNPIDYFELYDAVSDEPIRGEASHAYLSDPTTARVLKALFPDSKFVVILRNPADRAYSLYHWMRRRGYEYIKTFERALEAEEGRYNSIQFMEQCPHYFYNSLYFRSGLYGDQLKRYFKIFSRDRFHIIKFEDFIVNRLKYTRDICRFLGIDSEFSPNLDAKTNSGNVTARYPGIQYYVTNKLNRFRRTRKQCLKLLEKVNVTNVLPLSRETRERLLERYSSDLQDLFDMTGISFV